MMDTKKIIEDLRSFVQLDYDAARAYEQAIDGIEEKDRYIRDQFTRFRNDHERHIADLSALIARYGGTPPKRSRDAQGFLIEGFTAVRSATGTAGALKAMHTNEKLTNRRYAEALTRDLPPEVTDIVRKNYGDEQHHLAYIESALSMAPAAR